MAPAPGLLRLVLAAEARRHVRPARSAGPADGLVLGPELVGELQHVLDDLVALLQGQVPRRLDGRRSPPKQSRIGPRSLIEPAHCQASTNATGSRFTTHEAMA